jgi:cold shock CspA family protein
MMPEITPEVTLTGVVKWFDKSKGYGFITVEVDEAAQVVQQAQAAEEPRDLFFPVDAVSSDSIGQLQEGDRVSFSIKTGEDGESAHNVQKIAADTSIDASTGIG